MVKIYVLIETYDSVDDGFTIIGVFSSLKLLRDYVTINHAEFKLDEYGDYYCKDKNNKFTDYTYLTIYEQELINNVKLEVE